MKKQPRITISTEALKEAKLAAPLIGLNLSEFASEAVLSKSAPIIRREVTKRGKKEDA